MLLFIVKKRDAGFGGANLSAIAAVGTQIGVDDISWVTDGDRRFRAFR
jgi:hypothetical protein